MHEARLSGVLCADLVHFYHMQVGLVLVKGLQNYHLSGYEKSGAAEGMLTQSWCTRVWAMDHVEATWSPLQGLTDHGTHLAGNWLAVTEQL